MTADKLAEIIAANTDPKTVMECGVAIVYKMLDGAGFIDALADEMEVDNSLCYYKMRCQHAEHDFDRAAWVAKATP